MNSRFSRRTTFETTPCFPFSFPARTATLSPDTMFHCWITSPFAASRLAIRDSSPRKRCGILPPGAYSGGAALPAARTHACVGACAAQSLVHLTSPYQRESCASRRCAHATRSQQQQQQQQSRQSQAEVMASGGR